MHPGGHVGRQVERAAGGDQDEAVGALGNEGADLLRVEGVVQDDRDGQPGQMLVVQLAQPLDLLVRGGTLTEQELLAGGAEAVEEVQQRVPGGQGLLLRGVAAQVDHARAAEVVPQVVGGAHRECRTTAAGRPVQDDDRRPGLGARAGRLHPLPDPRHLLTAARERTDRLGQLTEGLLQHVPAPGRRALVRALQSRTRPLRPGRGVPHPLLVEVGADAAHLERRQPLQPQLLRAAGLAERARAVVGGGQMRAGHLHDRRRGAHHSHGDPGAERRTRAGAERQVGDGGRDRRDARHQQRSTAALARVPLPERELTGLRLLQGAPVRLVLLRGGLRHRVQRPARPRQQYGPVGTPARPPYLFLHGPRQQPLGLRAMTVPHVTSPSGGNGSFSSVP
ncbi:hypothetical protein QFZ76_006449 [Streptomyces sp. V4I2]|nr:hypothetical protein [Streptomyces sp. V4I2]